MVITKRLERLRNALLLLYYKSSQASKRFRQGRICIAINFMTAVALRQRCLCKMVLGLYTTPNGVCKDTVAVAKDGMIDIWTQPIVKNNRKKSEFSE